MHLGVFIVLALTALAAAQQSDSSITPIFVMPISQDPSTLPSESDPSSFPPPFDQGSATDGSASTDMPSVNFNSDRPATNDFSSFSSFPQQQQQSQTGVDMPAATSLQPVLSTNLLIFPSVPLSVPTTAFQQTPNALTGPASPAIQQDGTADPTGVPAASTLQTEIPASASALFTAQAGMLESTVQPTAVPATGTQPAAIESTPLSMLPTSFATTPFQAPQAMAPTTAPIVFQTTPLPTVIPSTPYPPSQPPSTALPTVFPTTPFPTKQTSAGPPPEVPTHIQIIFNNSYTNTVPDSINMADFTRGLASSLAALLQVPLYRISNVTVLSQPQTGFLVLRFVVLPSITTISTSPATSVTAFVPVDAIEVVVNQLRDLVLSIGSTFQLASQNSTVLTVNRQSNDQIFASWTESGPCPKTPCGSSGSCVCSLTGTLQCQSPSQSSILFPASAPNLLLLLLLLLFIPLVIFIVLVVIRVRRRKPHQKKQQQQQPEKRVVRADMLSYHEYVAREKDPQQPKIATIASRSTINHSTLNSLHKYLGENISIAYNGASFLDNMAVDNADSTSRDAILPNGN